MDKYRSTREAGFVSKIERFIYETSFWKLVSLILLLNLFKTGIWYIPNIDLSVQVARDPFANPFANPEAHYLFWNWLGAWLAWLVGATERWSFIALHLLFSIGFTALFISLAARNLDDTRSRTSIVLFSLLPVSGTAYYWVGSDSISLFLLLLPFAFPARRVPVFLCGLLLGMQHFEQGFLALAALLVMLLLGRGQGVRYGYSITFCVVFLAGIVAGKIALIALFQYHDIAVNSGRWFWLKANIDQLLAYFGYHFHFILWSILGLCWLVALRFAEEFGRRSWPFFASLLLLMLLLPVTADQTRVLSITLLPLLAVAWLFNDDFLGRLQPREVSLLFIIWALMPWIWVWAGEPKWSVLPYNLALLLHEWFGWFDVSDYPLWPFQAKPR